jgi:LL-diaminopimelate aminotransferase
MLAGGVLIVGTGQGNAPPVHYESFGPRVSYVPGTAGARNVGRAAALAVGMYIMSEPFFQNSFADRIGGSNYGKGTAIYKFEKIKRAKRQALKDFPDRKLLDFGIGENDEMADPSVRAAMKAEIDKPENRGYADNGVQPFKDAAAAYMKRQFGVEVDPVREVIHCIGTKPAYVILPAVFINPGDITLMTVPGYPVAGTHTRYYGGQVYNMPLLPENDFLPDLGVIPSDVCRRAKLMVLNYPNSPTGKVATVDFYKRVIEFAHKHSIVVAQDAAHILLTYEGAPLSFLSVDGAKDVGVEVHSMSKGYHMIGWRMGFVAGHPLIIQAFGDVKDNSDSGQFIATQLAAKAALDNDAIPQRVRAKYRRRLQKLVAALREVGFDAKMPGGTYFLYCRAPSGAAGRQFANAEGVSQYLIESHSIVTVPWDDAGAFLRFSVTYVADTEADEDALMEETRRRLRKADLVFSRKGS